MTRPDATAIADPAGRDGYERLRHHAVKPGSGERIHGLAVLARRGLAAWLCTCVESPGDVAPPRRRRSPEQPLSGEMVQAIDILLAMTRAHLATRTSP